jgi:nucleotidyltransferase/DNA polymerase involved in DNA repair
MRADSLIGHLDADSFYVSAERVRDPFLLGKQVAVLGNQGACVIAKSYEMKRAGVKTGEPIWEAKKKCPDGVYIKRDFRWYEVLSRAMHATLQQLSPTLEYYSIDEFFFEVLHDPKYTPQATAVAIRDRVSQAVGVPVTVGIGRSKSLAKLFSDTAKPFGARAAVDRAEEEALLEKLPVTEISGIASRRAARLAEHGITTCLEFARAERRLIRMLLTAIGEDLWWELNGTPAVKLCTERPPHKMIARGGSLGESTADPDRLHAWMVRNLERLIEELEFYAVKAGRLHLWLGYTASGGMSAAAPLLAPTDRFDLLLDACRFAVERSWNGAAVNRMHLMASQLARPSFVQRGLFEPPAEQAAAVAEIKREVNAKCGRFSLRSGATLPLTEVYSDAAQIFDICDVRGKMCF